MRRFCLGAAIAACVASSSVTPAWAQATRTEEAGAVADAFFAQLKEGSAKAAFERAFQGTILAATKPGELNMLITQTDGALKYYGKIERAEFVGEKALSPSIVKQTYVLMTENGPLFWKFYLYKNAGSWRLMTIQFDDNIRAALD